MINDKPSLTEAKMDLAADFQALMDEGNVTLNGYHNWPQRMAFFLGAHRAEIAAALRLAAIVSEPPDSSEQNAALRRHFMSAVDAYSHRVADRHPGFALERFVAESIAITQRAVADALEAANTEIADLKADPGPDCPICAGTGNDERRAYDVIPDKNGEPRQRGPEQCVCAAPKAWLLPQRCPTTMRL